VRVKLFAVRLVYANEEDGGRVPSPDRRTRRRICKISLIRPTVSPILFHGHSTISHYARLPCVCTREKIFSRHRLVSSDRLSTSVRTGLTFIPFSRPPPFSRRTPSGSFPSRFITNAAKFLTGKTKSTHLQRSRVRVQSLVHWIWVDVMPGWPGHSFTHLSRFASIFRNAVQHCLNTSRRVTLIAASAIATPAFYSRSLPRRARFRPSPPPLFTPHPPFPPRAPFRSRIFISRKQKSKLYADAHAGKSGNLRRSWTNVGIEHKLWPIFQPRLLFT